LPYDFCLSSLCGRFFARKPRKRGGLLGFFRHFRFALCFCLPTHKEAALVLIFWKALCEVIPIAAGYASASIWGSAPSVVSRTVLPAWFSSSELRYARAGVFFFFWRPPSKRFCAAVACRREGFLFLFRVLLFSKAPSYEYALSNRRRRWWLGGCPLSANCTILPREIPRLELSQARK